MAIFNSRLFREIYSDRIGVPKGTCKHYWGIEYIPIFLALNGYPMSVIAKFATKQLKDATYLQTKDLGLQLIDTDQESNV